MAAEYQEDVPPLVHHSHMHAEHMVEVVLKEEEDHNHPPLVPQVVVASFEDILFLSREHCTDMQHLGLLG